jgi:hypothetical protein
MILISNNVQKYMEVPKEAVIRINMAWVKTLLELEAIIIGNSDRIIFLDYPEGRAKPPKPTLPLSDAYILCAKYSNIRYFAVSNVEEPERVKEIQKNLPETVEFVPKIETRKGVGNLTNLIMGCNIKTMMLDKEDLYTDVDKKNDDFFSCISVARGLCNVLNVNLLELEGVTFVTRGQDAIKS